MCHCLEHASVNSKTPENMARLTAGESAIAIGMVQLGASYAHFAWILNCTKLTITRLIQRYRKRKIPHHSQTRTTISASYTYVTHSSLWRHLQRLALDMSVVTLYVVDYDSMVSGPIDHSEGCHWWGNIEFGVYVGHVSFNVGNIGSGNVYYLFLMRTGFSYSQLMAGLGYIDVQEREQLRAVFRRPYRLVVDLWWFWAVSVANNGQTLLSLTEISPHSVTSTRFYVPSCYRSCNTNLDSCFNRTMPDLTQLVWCISSSPQTKSMFAMASPFTWPVTDRTSVGSSWPANSTSS